MIKKSFLLTVLLLIGFVISGYSQQKHAREKHSYYIENGILGTYSNPPRLADGQVDDQRLISQLKTMGANTYNWLIRDGANDLDALKHFLPLARQAGLKVWVTLLPPSEPPFSEPFRLDYDQWAAELAVLSKKEPNLVAWSIDDFINNIRFYSPEYVREFISRSRAINPKLAFIPCCYYKYITAAFVSDYAGLLGGILFPYRAESEGGNLKNPMLVGQEISKLRTMLPPAFPIILDVYASPHSRLGATTPAYVRQVVNTGIKTADGVLIYCHQDPQKNAEKYQIITEEFTKAASRSK